MTITVACDIFGEENNGTVVVTMNLIRYLRKQGHDVRILCADQNQKGKENFFVVPNKNLGKPLNEYVKRTGVTLAKPDKEIVRQALEGCDHVHIMMPLWLGIATAKLAHEMGLPITAGFHMQAENFTAYVNLNKLHSVNDLVYKFIYKHVYQYVDGIHYPTEFIRNVFESRIKKRTNGYVISNGVHSYAKKYDVEKPDGLKDKFVILSTGRYSSEKSQDTLIKAIALSAHKENIQLILAGEGTKKKRFMRLSEKLPIPPIFKFFSRKEIIDVVNYCDLYVHPAVAELEGIACLESIACGKMTIVSDSKNSATQNFAIDEKCIFKNKDAKDLARVIDYWIEHPEERAEYEKKYLSSSVVYNQEECMRKMERMIFEVVEKKRNG